MVNLKDRYKNMIKEDFKKNINNLSNNSKILLIGDSQIELFKQSKIFKEINKEFEIEFLSARAADSFDILKVVSENIQIVKNYKIIFLLFGTNDLAYGYTYAETITNFEKIILCFKTNNIDNYHFISILNVNLEYSENEKIYLLSNRTIKKVSKINDFLNTKGNFIDVRYLLNDQDANLAIKNTDDGLHLNENGYKILVNEVKKNVED